MKLTCTHCSGTFSIRAEQLGTRGKCPHCRGTIILPRASNRFIDSEELVPPSLWTERGMSVLVTVMLHLVVLSILALLPSRYARTRSSAEGQAVNIGTADALSLTSQSSSEELSPTPVTLDASQPMLDLFQEQATAPVSGSEAEAASTLLLPSAGDGMRAENEEPDSFQGDSDGERDLESLLTELRQNGLEIVIVFDSTGSMEGEIRQVKLRIQRMGAALLKLIPKTRISLCTYRDRDARYLVQGIPLTDDLDSLVEFLSEIEAAGGGDDPEAVDAGLDWAIGKNVFRERSRKVILLFGDSPPHYGDMTRCLELVSTFRRQQDGVVSTVTCHSNARLPEFIEIAQLGGGEAFLARDETEIMSQLLVLVFGSQYREEVLKAFQLMNR